MKKYLDPRHQARIIVLQLLFADEFRSKRFEKQQIRFSIEALKDLNGVETVDEDMITSIYEGVEKHKGEIDEIIGGKAVKHPLEQVLCCDLCILRIALFEGHIEKMTPWKVAIDEAIELAKVFGNNKSTNFINGILGNI